MWANVRDRGLRATGDLKKVGGRAGNTSTYSYSSDPGSGLEPEPHHLPVPSHLALKSKTRDLYPPQVKCRDNTWS